MVLRMNSPDMPSWHGQVQIYFHLLSNCRSPVKAVFTLCRSPEQTVIAYAEAQYRLSLRLQKPNTDFSCEKYEHDLYRVFHDFRA